MQIVDTQTDRWFKIKENVVFQKVNDVSITKDKWLVSTVVVLSPYDDYLEQISADMNKANDTTHTIWSYWPVKSQVDYSTMCTNMLGEVIKLETMHDSLTSSYAAYDPLTKGKRWKRGLLDVIGDAASFLFGIPKEKQVDGLRQKIIDGSKKQLDIVHVLNESLSILNSS